MKNLHIIMPMGGLGSRTSDVYTAPKPFINIYNKYLFEFALEGFKSVKNSFMTKLTIVVRSEMLDDNRRKNINKIGWDFADKFNLVEIDKLTRGSLDTVMKAKHLIDDDDICVILDCDLIFQYDDLYYLLSEIDENNLYDGFLLSFNSNKNRYSYAKITGNNIVIKTAEKNPISNHALAGVYGISSGKTLKQYADVVLNLPFELNEYYVSSIYNFMIEDGAKIYMGYLDDYHSIGTSEEIKEFKSSQNKYVSLYITDFDGTLVDTMEANYEAYKETFKIIYNSDLSYGDYCENFGLRLEELLDKLLLDPSKVDEVRKMKSEVYKKYFDKIKININLISYLNLKKRQGHRIACATTASRKNVENVLAYFKISNLFDYIITGEDVKNGKPDPEVYNKVIGKNEDIELYNMFVFEDSDVGLLAARNTIIPDNNIINIKKSLFRFNKFIDKEQFDNKTHKNYNRLL